MVYWWKEHIHRNGNKKGKGKGYNTVEIYQVKAKWWNTLNLNFRRGMTQSDILKRLIRQQYECWIGQRGGGESNELLLYSRDKNNKGMNQVDSESGKKKN